MMASAFFKSLASGEKATWVSGETALRVAAGMVVPPCVTLPRPPCQSIVQPPHCVPKSSAAPPTTARRLIFFESGKVCFSFLSSTSDSRTHSRATAQCSGGADGGGELRVGRGAFKKSELEFDPQNPAHGIVNACRRNFSFGNERLQIVNESNVIVWFARAVWNHDHVQPGVDGLLDVVFVVGRKLVNRGPVGDEKTSEAEFFF